MIIKSFVCPGINWRPLPVGFVISELSGKQTQTSAADRFWIWEPACQ